MFSNNHFQKVAIVGATGHIGSMFMESLLETGKHDVTVLTRINSTATFPSTVKVAKVDYDDRDALESVLKGHEFLIITLPTTALGMHAQIVDAAAKAGIPYIMPNGYGYDFRKSVLCQEILHGMSIEAIEDVRKAGPSFVAMCCGFWYEWSLSNGEASFGIDIAKKQAVFFDDGKTKISSSSWPECGKALAALLSLPVKKEGSGPALEDWKNQPFLISSFCISQRDMLDSVHRVLGTSDADWTITFEKSEERYKKALADMQAGDMKGFVRAMYTRSFYPTGETNLESEKVNGLLGLGQEKLDDATRRAVKRVEDGTTY